MSIESSNHSIMDQTGRRIEVSKDPRKIISLVPSITEMLFDLGLEEQIAGVTKFCIHPKELVQNKLSVGGTKKLHLDKIKSVQPDLVIANKEENSKEDILELIDQFPVYLSDITTLDDAYQMIDSIGVLVNKHDEARHLVKNIKNNFSAIPLLPGINICYLIWQKPFMAAGVGTFINTLIEKSGLKNVVKENRYPEVKLENIDADLILLSSEPFPFNEKYINQLQDQFPEKKFLLVDGEMFSWYGSRLRLFPDYIKSIATAFKSSQK